MRCGLVLTVIGPDRTGLVETIASIVADHGGNWVESRLAHLAGKFAGVVCVDVASADSERLTKALTALADHGLHVVVESTTDEVAPAAPTGRLFTLELLGHDRPGIVREIAAALAARQVNVETLDSETYPAPMSGEAMFKVTATLGAPSQTDVEDLERTLDQIADQLDLDLTLHEGRVGSSA